MLYITNSQLYYLEIEGAKDKTIVDDSDFLSYLSDDVKFSDDLVFGRLFDLFIQHKDLLNMIFSSSMRNFQIDQYIQDFYNEPKNDKEFYLTVGIHTDLWKYEKVEELNLYYSFGGYNETEQIAYSVGFTPLSDLRNLPIKLSDKFEIYKMSKKKYNKILSTSNFRIKLFDIIDAILHEITFFGTPKHRDDQMKELDRRSEEMDEHIKNGTLDQVTSPWEEVEIKMEEKMLQMAIDNEEYEEAETINKRIKKLKKKLKKLKK